MRRLIEETVKVQLTPDRSAPAIFWRGGQAYPVRIVQAYWRLMGAWWDGEGEQSFFRVFTTRGTYELCLDHDSRQWRLVYIYD
jgi:hypothetical protein